MGIGAYGTKRLVQICNALGADTYLSGPFAIDQYLKLEEFQTKHIRVVYPDFICSPYRQCTHKDFCPDLSIIDLVMNCSPDHMRSDLKECKLVEV